MNQIRSHWKDNGTPFFFNFNAGHERFVLDSFTCSSYDKVVVQDDGRTAMDCLVDIRHVIKALEQVDDILVKSAVNDALLTVFKNLQYIVSLNKNANSNERN